MKKLTLTGLIFLLNLISLNNNAQNPGLVISEIFPNPAGTDSCKEYVELRVTKFIDFSSTPYTVIMCNNGTANTNGWVAGSNLTYAFAITSGTVNTGQVVYVGGVCMAPNGIKIRAINVSTTGGDGGIGNANNSGIFGNGGSNADGVAVFNLPVGSITSASIPVDALFYGTALGSAIVGAGQGYQLPVNDIYSGGKLTASSFFTGDPGANIITAHGVYNITTDSWSTNRTFSVSTNHSDGVSTVLLTSNSPAGVSFVTNDTTVSESASSANIYLKIASTSTAPCSVDVTYSSWSNASASDYTFATTTVTFAANAPVNTSAPITINITNDGIVESDEYIIVKLTNPVNCNVTGITQFAFYIKDDDKIIPTPSNAISLNLLASFSNTVSGSNSAEIVVHDPTTQRLYIANSINGKLDIVNFINPSTPVLMSSVNILSYGNINSVAVKNGLVAVAIENTNPQDSGKVVFFDKDGNFLKQVKVGMMPDMITFNHTGNKVYTANEGEPNAAYTNDPDGSISIIDLSGGIATLNQNNVSHITFTAYNGQEPTLKTQGIRIFGLGASASKDFEPEYISISADDSKAWVTLQENNAIVELNLTNNTINYIKALGTKNHNLLNNSMDASNVTKGVNISNFPVKGFYLPDAIASYSLGGVNYLITANEGDARAYSGFTEEKRVNQLVLDPVKFPNASELQNNYVLGRLTVTDKSGDTDNDGDIDTIYCYGSRSFSIWNANTGALVYDSKDDMEQITSTNSFSVMFNASNTSITKKDRSDDKGPEPEGVAIGTINGNIYAFIALERIGGVMVYDVTNPNTPVFVTYVNNRSFSSNGPDRGAEGIIFIPQSQSPNGQHIVIAANEVSSTLSIWGIPGCTTPLSSSLSVTGNTVFCQGDSVLINVPLNGSATYQWKLNGTNLLGATNHSVYAKASGNYSVEINNGANCSTGSLSQSVTVYALPSLTVSGTNICAGSSANLIASGTNTYSWSTGATSPGIIVLTPTASVIYTVTGTNTVTTCKSSKTITLTVNPLPNVSLTANSNNICTSGTGGTVVNLNGSPAGGVYSGANVSGATFNAPTNPGIYTATYTYSNSTTGCQNSAATTISVAVCTGINEIAQSNQIKIYPNPAKEKVIIEFESEYKNVKIELYNALGSKVNASLFTDANKTEINVSELAKGLYFIKISENGKEIVAKLIKE